VLFAMPLEIPRIFDTSHGATQRKSVMVEATYRSKIAPTSMLNI
jgi:hypothetical protein